KIHSQMKAAAKGRADSWLPHRSNRAEKVKEQTPDVLLIDLGSPHLDAVNAIKEIKSGDCKSTVVIGYLDHTREDLIEAARAAGCDQVMSKGEFARRLPELLDGL